MQKGKRREKELALLFANAFELLSIGKNGTAKRKLNLAKINHKFTDSDFRILLKRLGF